MEATFPLVNCIAFIIRKDISWIMDIKKLTFNKPASLLKVEVTGLEPATAWSQTRNATNCATPRFCGCKGTQLYE